MRAEQRLQDADTFQEKQAYQQQAELGMLLKDWGIPTSAAVALSSQLPLNVVASGGISNSLIAAKAFALGADLVGFARPILQAYLDHGEEGADLFIKNFVHGLKVLMALTGAQTIPQLQKVPYILGPRLQSWIQQGKFDQSKASSFR